MKRVSLFMMAAAVVFAVSLVSCAKDGATGPVGPAGPAGPTGSTGATGAPGATGATGTANVIYSGWYKFATSEWKIDSAVLATYYYYAKAEKASAAVTQTILDQGIVLAYMKVDTLTLKDGPYQLPHTFYLNSTVGHVEVKVKPVLGKVIIYNEPELVYGAALPTFFQYRHVIIPGGTSGGRIMSGPAAGMNVDELKKMSYTAVCKKFDIPLEGSNE